MEFESYIEIVKVGYTCHKCWCGEMEIDNDYLEDDVSFWDFKNKHKCNKCGHTEMLVGIYPYIKDIEDDE